MGPTNQKHAKVQNKGHSTNWREGACHSTNLVKGPGHSTKIKTPDRESTKIHYKVAKVRDSTNPGSRFDKKNHPLIPRSRFDKKPPPLIPRSRFDKKPPPLIPRSRFDKSPGPRLDKFVASPSPCMPLDKFLKGRSRFDKFERQGACDSTNLPFDAVRQLSQHQTITSKSETTLEVPNESSNTRSLSTVCNKDKCNPRSERMFAEPPPVLERGRWPINWETGEICSTCHVCRTRPRHLFWIRPRRKKHKESPFKRRRRMAKSTTSDDVNVPPMPKSSKDGPESFLNLGDAGWTRKQSLVPENNFGNHFCSNSPGSFAGYFPSSILTQKESRLMTQPLQGGGNDVEFGSYLPGPILIPVMEKNDQFSGKHRTAKQKKNTTVRDFPGEEQNNSSNFQIITRVPKGDEIIQLGLSRTNNERC